MREKTGPPRARTIPGFIITCHPLSLSVGARPWWWSKPRGAQRYLSREMQLIVAKIADGSKMEAESNRANRKIGMTPNRVPPKVLALAIETLVGAALIPNKIFWGSHLHVMRYADFKKCKMCCPRTTMLSWDNNWDIDTGPTSEFSAPLFHNS